MTYPANTVPCPDCEGTSVDFWVGPCLPCGGCGYVDSESEVSSRLLPLTSDSKTCYDPNPNPVVSALATTTRKAGNG